MMDEKPFPRYAAGVFVDVCVWRGGGAVVTNDW